MGLPFTGTNPIVDPPRVDSLRDQIHN